MFSARAGNFIFTNFVETDCDLYTCDRNDYLNCLRSFPEYFNEVKIVVFERIKKYNEAISALHKTILSYGF